ncbi:hypothetical protein CHARACLAT_014273, partial [Characodon lateralis]|nr:hypothetical protein [Characodon lateralis]
MTFSSCQDRRPFCSITVMHLVCAKLIFKRELVSAGVTAYIRLSAHFTAVFFCTADVSSLKRRCKPCSSSRRSE